MGYAIIDAKSIDLLIPSVFPPSKVEPIKSLWVAGETMAGSILRQGYLARLGMTIETVFGRIVGREAAAYAN